MKPFKVYAKSEADIPKAEILEALINSPAFQSAILAEFKKNAKEIAVRIMADTLYPMREIKL